MGFTGFDVMIGAALGRRIDQYKKFKEFLGPRVFKLFIAAIGVGVLAFCVEASFVLISQGFLNALGIVGEEQLRLPAWYPRGIGPSVISLCIFGTARGIVQGYRRFLGSYISSLFSAEQRKQLYSFGLLNANRVSTSEIMSVFGDRVRESGQVLQNFSNMATLATSSLLLFVLGLKIAPVELILGVLLLLLVMLPLKKTNAQISVAGQGLVKDWGGCPYLRRTSPEFRNGFSFLGDFKILLQIETLQLTHKLRNFLVTLQGSKLRFSI